MRELWRFFWFLVGVAAIVVIAMLVNGSAHAASTAPGRIIIPATSTQYRLRLERAAGEQFGLNAPVARLAAQIHQESHWNARAASIYAQGLAQFTPATAEWLPGVCPEVGKPDPWDANWSIRAIACYDAWLYARVDGAADCDRWAFTLSAYNGGLGWVNRDRRRASGKGLDAARWFGNVEDESGRAAWARAENRGYVSRILLLIEPVYVAAGWPGRTVCT